MTFENANANLTVTEVNHKRLVKGQTLGPLQLGSPTLVPRRTKLLRAAFTYVGTESIRGTLFPSARFW